MLKGWFGLDGKVALITGATQGIGLGIARALGQAGARVVLNARDPRKLSGAIKTLSAERIEVSGSVFDVTRSEAVRNGIAAIEASTGPVHILVNNAGIQRRSPLEDLDESTWRAVLDTNLTGVFLVSQQVARGMITRRSGKIINICSLMCEVARPSVAAYAAAKGGLRQLTKAMAVEWAKHNIQVNGLGPGYIATEMNRALTDDEKFSAWVCSRTPAGRWGQPEDLGGAAVFLASHASDFVTGQILYVDGGILGAL